MSIPESPPVAPARIPPTEGRRAWTFRYRNVLTGLIVGPALLAAGLGEPLVVRGSVLWLVAAGLGWICFVLGAALRFASTLFVGGRKRKVLVTDGPYGVTRNPLYLGSLLLGLAAGCFLGSLTVLAAVLLAGWITTRTTIAAEERDLSEIHGAAFRDYVARVPRLLPRLSGWRTPGPIEVLWPGLKLEARRFLLWGWVPLACLLLNVLKTQPWWPRLLQLP